MGRRINFIVFLATLLVSWSVEEDVTPATPPGSTSGIQNFSKNEGHVLVEKITDFGISLLSKMMELTPGTNIVMSPSTVAGLMAMSMLGCVGTTFEEIVRIMGFSSDVTAYRKKHTLFGDLLSELNADNATKTSYANAVFVDDQVKLRELYKSFTERTYRGTITNLDFKNTTSMDVINQWVRDHTNDKIPSLFQEPLPSDTQVVLLSALYFAGQWKTPFTPRFTQNMTFLMENGTEIEAELMLNYGKFNYILDTKLDAHMVALPYKGDETVLYVIKPYENKSNLTDLIKKLNAKTLDELIEKSANSTCIIRFPKMQLNYRSDLVQSLKLLGIETMFTHRANFALMIEPPEWKNTTEDETLILRTAEELDQTGGKVYLERLNKLPNPGVYVDTIIHEVQMNINEFGTEASAAASSSVSRTAELFYADSPFYFFIRNEKTKLITFSAAIFDPTNKQFNK